MNHEPLTILHLEGQQPDAENIRKAVRQDWPEATIHLVTDAASFKQTLRRLTPDVVLSDYGMPGLNGPEVVELVRVRNPFIPVIFVADSIGEEQAIEILRHGAADYVLKERLTRLGPAVRRAIDESRQRLDAEQATRALLASEERLKHALDATHDGLWDWNIKSGDVYFSPQWSRLLGYPPDEVPPRVEFFYQILHPEDMGRVKQLVDDHLGGRSPVKQGEIRLRMKTGEYRWFFDCGKIVTWDPAGVPVRMVGTITDITERKQAEQTSARLEAELQQAHKMESLGTLAGGIAHDFNNILGAIIGFSELVRSDLPQSSPSLNDIGEVLKAANRARHLVEQILTFSRQQPQDLQPMRLADAVQEASHLLRATTPSSIEVRLKLSPGTPTILGDPTQIHQIVINLASNAIHAIPDSGGLIEIGTGPREVTADDAAGDPDLRPGPHAVLSIRDNGCGMDGSVQQRMFDPFFTTKGPGAGTGLGLAVVHGIVKKHQGTIRVTSAPGQGARFELMFPALTMAEEPARDQPGGVVAGQGRRVMLVDDEPALARVSKLMLERLGFEVAVFTDSTLAWETFDAGPDQFDLVVSDQTMPRMTGLEFSTRILKRRPGLPVILMTGYHASASPERVREAGVAELMMKPFTFDSLNHTLRKALGSSQV